MEGDGEKKREKKGRSRDSSPKPKNESLTSSSAVHACICVLVNGALYVCIYTPSPQQPIWQAEALELAEIELEEEKLALQKKELELRARKLALLRERQGGGNIPIVFPQSYWRAYKQCNALAFNE